MQHSKVKKVKRLNLLSIVITTIQAWDSWGYGIGCVEFVMFVLVKIIARLL
jgi:hypothetical protein